ncbi:hypothetical protein B0A53_00423 [Rhodotorula sp. CCFEE 5036]|nr:hypothetical protein B0A53_00423 [Rhodotorula sp. CCFEE 5036]
MGESTIPDETNSLSLLTDPDIRTFIKVNSNGKLLPIFEKSRAGDKKVNGFVPAAEGVDFSVGWYCGRTKNLKSSILIEVYFGETLVSDSFHLASDFDPEDPLDDEWRFLMFESVAVGTDSKRGFRFGKIPTTDDQDAAAKDLDYLDSVSAIRVETYTITNARYVITGWKQPSPSKKTAQKRSATQITGSSTATAEVSPVNNQGAASQDAVKPEQPPMPRSVREVEASLRPIDEKSDKGNFGPVVANEQDAPGEQENGVAAYGTAALTGPSLTTPQTTPQQSWADNTSEYVGRKRSKKEKKKPIRQLKYDSVKHASTSVFLLRSLPWISKHLDDFFFKPTEALRPEPTVEVGGAIYLDDTTAEEAAEDARAAAAVERPAKRQKVVDLVDEGNLNEIDSPTEDEDADDDDDDEDEDEDAAQASDTEEGAQDRQAVFAGGGGSSLLANVLPRGTTAGQSQTAEEHSRSRATQLVRSLAEDHPDFNKVKQEVFARKPSSSRLPEPDAHAASTGAASVIVPDKEHSLPTKGEPAIKAYIAVGGQPLAVYDKERHGKSHIEGTVTVEPGAEFVVGVYAAMKTKPRTSGLVTVNFGETTVLKEEICDFRFFDPATAADSAKRYTSFDGLTMSAGGTRKFTFGQLPTTDDDSSAVKDVEYLKKASSTTVEYTYITGLTYGVTGWEKADVETAQAVTAYDSKAGTDEKNEVADELNSRDFAEEYKQSLRPIDETDNKRKFSMVAGFGPLHGGQQQVIDPDKDIFVFHLRPPTLSQDNTKPAEVGESLKRPFKRRKVGQISARSEAGDVQPPVASSSGVGATGATIVGIGTQKGLPARH